MLRQRLPAGLLSGAMGQEREESRGYFEMLWDCDHCDARGLLAKSQRHCANCGAPQNPDKRYFPREGEERRVDGHLLRGRGPGLPGMQLAAVGTREELHPLRLGARRCRRGPRCVRCPGRPTHRPRQAAPPTADLAVCAQCARDLRVRHLVALRAQPERRGRGQSHGPRARAPTHRRPRYRDRRKARYRLGRLTHWLGGVCTRWMTYRISRSYRILAPFGPALPGRN